MLIILTMMILIAMTRIAFKKILMEGAVTVVMMIKIRKITRGRKINYSFDAHFIHLNDHELERRKIREREKKR